MPSEITESEIRSQLPVEFQQAKIRPGPIDTFLRPRSSGGLYTGKFDVLVEGPKGELKSFEVKIPIRSN